MPRKITKHQKFITELKTHFGASLPDKRAALASASGSARLPGHKLADILVSHGVIQASAVEDPEGYDGGDTMARVAGVAIELCQLLAQNAKAEPTAPDGDGGSQKGLSK